MPWIGSRLGTRGVALALLGLMWIGRGLVVIHDSGIPNPDEAILHLLLPVPWRVGLWVGTGAAALATCWSSRAQIAGWGLILIMPVERAVSHLWSLAMWIVPGRPGGTPWAIAYSLWWVANTALLLVMAGWQEDSHDRIVRTQEGF